MTQYMLSVIHAEEGPDFAEDVDIQEVYGKVDAFNKELQDSGSWVFAGGLEPPSDSTVVDATGSEVLVTDGPYAETKEQLGGFWVVEAPDLDAALAIAKKGSAACVGSRGGPPVPGRVTHPAAPDGAGDDPGAGLAAVFRAEHGRVVASLARRFGDLDIAEDATGEALVVAAERWPTEGLPPNPGGWLTTVAGNKALDRIRREKRRQDKYAEVARMDNHDDPAEPTGPVEDDRLRLVFTCCHPALAPENRVALTLRLLGGLTVAEIAAAFLVPETTMAQRITRSKQKIKATNIPYRIPRAEDLPDANGRSACRALPGLQRGLPRLLRRGTAHRPHRRGDPADPAAARDGRRDPVAGPPTRGRRPPGADAARRLAPSGPSAQRRAGRRWTSRTARCGTPR